MWLVVYSNHHDLFRGSKRLQVDYFTTLLQRLVHVDPAGKLVVGCQREHPDPVFTSALITTVVGIIRAPRRKVRSGVLKARTRAQRERLFSIDSPRYVAKTSVSLRDGPPEAKDRRVPLARSVREVLAGEGGWGPRLVPYDVISSQFISCPSPLRVE